jgi:hypothetical protein
LISAIIKEATNDYVKRKLLLGTSEAERCWIYWQCVELMRKQDE